MRLEQQHVGESFSWSFENRPVCTRAGLTFVSRCDGTGRDPRRLHRMQGFLSQDNAASYERVATLWSKNSGVRGARYGGPLEQVDRGRSERLDVSVAEQNETPHIGSASSGRVSMRLSCVHGRPRSEYSRSSSKA